jgi:hypothetical protein
VGRILIPIPLTSFSVDLIPVWFGTVREASIPTRQSPSPPITARISSSPVMSAVATSRSSSMTHTAVLKGTGSTHFQARSTPMNLTHTPSVNRYFDPVLSVISGQYFQDKSVK